VWVAVHATLLRDRDGMPVQGVGHRLGIADGHLSNILRGSRTADDALLGRIAVAIEDVAAA